MARFKKCTDKDISILLDTSSDSDTKLFDESYVLTESAHNNSSDSSESDVIFEDDKSRKKEASLRLRLRRSTEQSLYKIDTESENEKPRRLTRNSKYLKKLQDENQMPRKSRRLSQRDQEKKEKELLASLDTASTKRKKKKDAVKNHDSDDSDCICISFSSKTPSTRLSKKMSENNKQNHQFSVEGNDNITPRVTRTKTSKYISSPEDKSGKNNTDKELSRKITVDSKDTVEDATLYGTPRKRSRMKENTCTNILTVSNKCDSTMQKDESKIKVNNKMEIVQDAVKNLSIKIKQERKDSSESVQEDLSILRTPTHTKSRRASLRPDALTPSMKMRTKALTKPVTPLQEARMRLHVSTVPKSLPCREEEFNDIYTFLEGKLMDNSGGCIYISGVPGTGKTATVNEIIKCLKRSVEKGKLSYFDFVEINGMKLSDPRQAYVQILKQLSGKMLTWEQAYNVLEKKFNSRAERPMTLLLVDELDLLCTKRQDVIYNLLDWPARTVARLIVITIANTMDLPERVLMGRVTSRLGLTRVTFQPYSHQQLQEIVLTRLKDVDVFKNEAIQLIARKVSAVSGDARRALDICRRAAEITEMRNGLAVTIHDVNEALSEMITNPKVQAIRHCSKFEQIFLQAICSEVTRIGVDEVCFINVYKQLEFLCSFDGLETPNITQMLDICVKLGDYRLLIYECSGSNIHQKILLNVSKDDIHYALKVD